MTANPKGRRNPTGTKGLTEKTLLTTLPSLTVKARGGRSHGLIPIEGNLLSLFLKSNKAKSIEKGL
jgi:hypothetical protein